MSLATDQPKFLPLTLYVLNNILYTLATLLPDFESCKDWNTSVIGKKSQFISSISNQPRYAYFMLMSTLFFMLSQFSECSMLLVCA